MEQYVYYDDKCQILPGRPLFPRNGLPLHQEHSQAGHLLTNKFSSASPRKSPPDPAASQHHIQTEYHQQPLARKVPHPEPRRNAGVGSIRRFFNHTNDYLTEDSFLHDPPAENIKITELIYLIVSHGDCCIKSKLLYNVDAARDNLLCCKPSMPVSFPIFRSKRSQNAATAP